MKTKLALGLSKKNKLMTTWIFLSMILITILMSVAFIWFRETSDPNNGVIFSIFNGKANNILLNDVLNGADLQLKLIIFFSFFLLKAIISFSIKQERDDWALLKLNGINSFEIVIILYIRFLVIGFAALVLGLFFSVYLINKYVYYFYYFIAKPILPYIEYINIKLTPYSILLTALTLIVMILICTSISIFKILSLKPVVLFNMNRNSGQKINVKMIFVRLIIGILLLIAFLYFTFIKPTETGTIVDIQLVGLIAVLFVLTISPIFIPLIAYFISLPLNLFNEGMRLYCKGQLIKNSKKNLSLAIPIFIGILVPCIFTLFSETSVVRMNMEYREQNKKMGDNVYAVISEDQDMSAKVIEDLRDIEGTNKLVITNPLAYYDAIDKNGFVGVNFINQESLMINLDLIEGDINKISGNNIGASNDYNLNDTINITYYDGEQKEYKIVAVFESVPYLLLPKIYLDYSTNKYKHGLDKMNEKLFLMNDTMNKNDLQYKINKLSDNLKICSGDEDINMRLKKFSLHEFDTIVFMLMPCLLLATIVIIQNIIELVKSKQQEFSTLFRMGFSRTEMIIETMLESLIVLISADVMIFGILFTMLIKFKKEFSLNEISIAADLPYRLFLYINTIFIILVVVISFVSAIYYTNENKLRNNII